MLEYGRSLTGVFVNGCEVVCVSHQAVPAFLWFFLLTTLGPVELSFQRPLPQGLSIRAIHPDKKQTR